MSEITQLLRRLEQGESEASDALMTVVYTSLRRLAAQKMANEQPGLTLQPTALVHEAWLRLNAETPPNWKNSAHFFGAAAEAMRRILVDGARRRARKKHGGGIEHIDADEVDIAVAGHSDDKILRVHEALEKFTALDPRKAELVKLRYFAGLSFEESAQVLGIAVPTAKGWWAYAKAWLSVEMGGSGEL